VFVRARDSKVFKMKASQCHVTRTLSFHNTNGLFTTRYDLNFEIYFRLILVLMAVPYLGGSVASLSPRNPSSIPAQSM
jgi:hypothetical protein